MSPAIIASALAVMVIGCIVSVVSRKGKHVAPVIVSFVLMAVCGILFLYLFESGRFSAILNAFAVLIVIVPLAVFLVMDRRRASDEDEPIIPYAANAAPPAWRVPSSDSQANRPSAGAFDTYGSGQMPAFEAVGKPSPEPSRSFDRSAAGADLSLDEDPETPVTPILIGKIVPPAINGESTDRGIPSPAAHAPASAAASAGRGTSRAAASSGASSHRPPTIFDIPPIDRKADSDWHDFESFDETDIDEPSVRDASSVVLCAIELPDDAFASARHASPPAKGAAAADGRPMMGAGASDVTDAFKSAPAARSGGFRPYADGRVAQPVADVPAVAPVVIPSVLVPAPVPAIAPAAVKQGTSAARPLDSFTSGASAWTPGTPVPVPAPIQAPIAVPAVERVPAADSSVPAPAAPVPADFAQAAQPAQPAPSAPIAFGHSEAVIEPVVASVPQGGGADSLMPVPGVPAFDLQDGAVPASSQAERQRFDGQPAQQNAPTATAQSPASFEQPAATVSPVPSVPAEGAVFGGEGADALSVPASPAALVDDAVAPAPGSADSAYEPVEDAASEDRTEAGEPEPEATVKAATVEELAAKAESLKAKGMFEVAGFLYCEAADQEPSASRARTLKFEALACFVRAGSGRKVQELVAELESSSVLTKAERMKLMAARRVG